MPEPEGDHRAHEGENRLHPCVATSVGVIAAIEQLTLRARLRRTAELAQALSGHEDVPERQTGPRDAAHVLTDDAWRANIDAGINSIRLASRPDGVELDRQVQL